MTPKGRTEGLILSLDAEEGERKGVKSTRVTEGGREKECWRDVGEVWSVRGAEGGVVWMRMREMARRGRAQD